MDSQKNIVSSSPESRTPEIDHRAIATIGAFCVSAFLFLMISLSALISVKAAFIALFVLLCLALIVWLSERGVNAYKHHQHHVHDMLDREHMRLLTRIAIANNHSVEWNPDTRQLRTISPWTIPSGPLTIKDINLGNNELAPALPIAPAFRSLKS